MATTVFQNVLLYKFRSFYDVERERSSPLKITFHNSFFFRN